MKISNLLQRTSISVFLAVTLGCSRSGEPGKPVDITWESCLRSLIDFASLPDLRDRNITMISSFDRTGGNDDFNNFASRSKENGWVVLADLKGPGCIRRFWMTGTDPGHPVRMFFDGEKTPRIEASFDDLFGAIPPWTPPLAQFINICRYSYIPVTYNKSLRIEAREPTVHPYWGPRRIFFQLAVESFPEGTTIETYPRSFSPAQLNAAKEIGDTWQSYIESRGSGLNQSTNALSEINPGSKADILQLDGPGTIRQFSIQVRPSDDASWSQIDREFLLQDTVLRVYYDRMDKPSIEVPLGDFFANPWRQRAYGSLWFTSSGHDYTCRLPMPYAGHIRIEIENGADKPVTVGFNYDHVAARSEHDGYLHAEYRRSSPDSTKPHIVTRLNGRGKYLGCSLGLTGLDQSWWILEGDERIWVDSNTQPAWHGTGLEDYFNSGWYYRGVAFGALNGNFDRAPFRVTQFRHHGPDPVGFQSFFQFEFERMNDQQSGLPVKGIFQSVAYAYLEKPGTVQSIGENRSARRAVTNPQDRPTFMLQLVELERANDYVAAIRYIDEYIERYPDAEENGVFLLRKLEYRRLLGEMVTDADYAPFLAGTHGATAKSQAELLTWFHGGTNRAIIGMNVNGRGRLLVNGAPLLAGDHPFNLFVAGVELTNGMQRLSAQVEYQRTEPWIQVGVRMHEGFVGTGLNATLCNRNNDPDWKPVGVHEILRGVPDAPFIGGIPNAFVLLQSKSYPIRGIDWGYHRGIYQFRQDFEFPTTNWPAFSTTMTGLSR